MVPAFLGGRFQVSSPPLLLPTVSVERGTHSPSVKVGQWWGGQGALIAPHGYLLKKRLSVGHSRVSSRIGGAGGARGVKAKGKGGFEEGLQGGGSGRGGGSWGASPGGVGVGMLGEQGTGRGGRRRGGLLDDREGLVPCGGGACAVRGRGRWVVECNLQAPFPHP